jgi:hypothetical protein
MTQAGHTARAAARAREGGEACWKSTGRAAGARPPAAAAASSSEGGRPASAPAPPTHTLLPSDALSSSPTTHHPLPLASQLRALLSSPMSNPSPAPGAQGASSSSSTAAASSTKGTHVRAAVQAVKNRQNKTIPVVRRLSIPHKALPPELLDAPPTSAHGPALTKLLSDGLCCDGTTVGWAETCGASTGLLPPSCPPCLLRRAADD